LKNKILNKSNLKALNNLAHLGNFPNKLRAYNSDYKNLEMFIDDFEKYLETQIDTPSLKLNSQDKIFEGIVSRLDVLSDFKKIVIRIYLESQKNPKLLITLNKYIHKYFSGFLKSPISLATSYLIYIYAFNIWIEDDENMDKTMAAIGNSFESINKIKSFIKIQ
tara:strand:- start:261 stop:752 length:492 start_codon:yes stop_codon:yes gene_type:complete